MSEHSTDTTPECPACHVSLPASASWAFCGNCGADLTAPVSTWRTLLRPGAFVVSPREPVVLPMVTSSMFPHMDDPSRRPFRHGLFLVWAMLFAFSMLRMLGPLVTVMSLGVSLLFGLYMWRSEAFRDISAGALVIAVLLGAGLSVLWWLGTGKVVAAAYGIPLGAAVQLEWALGLGLITTVVGALMMLIPAPVVRLLRLPARESLDGVFIGALGALSYSAAGTISWMAPQFTVGLLDNFGAWRLLEEAFLYGFIDPVTAAATGGLVGAALWFRPAHRTGEPRRIRLLLWLLAGFCLALYLGVYLVDAQELPRAVEMAICAVLTAISLVTLRAGIQIAVLHEAPELTSNESPETWVGPGFPSPTPAPTAPTPASLAKPPEVVCERCGAGVPDMSFCPECGVATRALSRSSRAQRRDSHL